MIGFLGGWDPNMLAEDTDLTFRVYLAGYKVRYVNEAECYEESVEGWRLYWHQRYRWAKGHMQCTFKHLWSLIKSGNLRLREKIDGFLLLNVFLKLGVDTIRIIGDMELPSGIEIRENIVVEGCLTIRNQCHFYGSVKASGDVRIGDNVVIEGNLVAGGSASIGRDAMVNGSVNAGGSVRLGQDTSIGLSLISGGDVMLCENARVAKTSFLMGTYASCGRLNHQNKHKPIKGQKTVAFSAFCS